MSNDQWEQVYQQVAELVAGHRTTLLFVNTRRMAERAARHLAEPLGPDRVAAHHGSLARETRLAAEQRLKAGELKVLVATASLELGLDIGDVDLVCQLGSPRSIAAFLQRAGRSGHAVGSTPKARLFPQTRDDLVECAALLDCVPDQAACAENLTGAREVPDHPLVEQTLQDCLYDAMDAAGWLQLLRGIEAGLITLHTCDLTAPSPLAAEAINARPYAFLDDAPLEERRTQAAQNRRYADLRSSDDLGRLDGEAIDAVRLEAWPEARNADEMHEALPRWA